MVIKKKKSIREQVYDYLKEEIVNGKIKEGSRIVEEEFAEKLNISRTPIREALRMLELEGLIEAREKGGVTVPKTTKKDVEEVVKIRIALETVIFEELFERVTEKDIEKLEENVAKADAIVNDEKKSLEVFRYFSEFNKILYNISDLPRVVTLINNLNLYLKKFRKISAENNNRRLSAHRDHTEIVNLIKAGKKDEAIAINKKHLLEAKEFLMKQVEN
ncbi:MULTISPECIES: GntR family transcriptional regulator [Cetobacterium]|uniref:GntR family transcriptional regulator n=1 Tax=Candidatus Cetobacterium colombiensis TaxID=3073100 RepID=A0ABU4WB67_9FUSO|nr:GntR family transcriptional regulator [Candidatus Cetobacterium colombiensis]MDX8336780.1 GntR family transcriptional regulator [Candidatus Cetobacterium colombiensis]